MFQRKNNQRLLYTTMLIFGVLLALAGSTQAAAAENAAGPTGLSGAWEPEPAEFIYTVKEGDTLGQIARSFDTTVAAILAANPEISNPNRIYAGQRIVIRTDEAAPRVDLSPINGPPGAKVEIRVWDFDPNAPLTLHVGQADGPHEASAKAVTDERGRAAVEIAIPEDASPDSRWTVIAQPFRDDSSTSFQRESPRFTVTDRAGAAQYEFLTIYLVARSDRGISGEWVGCGDSLVPVEIKVSETQAPIETALGRLLAIDEPVHEDSGLYTALDDADLLVADVRIERGLATIDLEGELALGGVCDEPRFLAQLEETAEQFYRVDETDIFINGELLYDPRETLRYTVREGDTLSHIAVSFGVPVDLILENNAQIDNPNRIIRGQTLNIPREKPILPRVILAPTNGPTGENVRVEGRGLPRNAEFEIGLGRADSEFEIVEKAQSNAAGELVATVEIPDHAETGERWVVVLTPASSAEKYVSNVYIVD